MMENVIDSNYSDDWVPRNGNLSREHESGNQNMSREHGSGSPALYQVICL